MTTAFAMLRLLPMSDRDKNVEILALRHQITVSKPKRPGRPRTVRSVRALVLRLAKENPSWDTAGFTANCSSWE